MSPFLYLRLDRQGQGIAHDFVNFVLCLFCHRFGGDHGDRCQSWIDDQAHCTGKLQGKADPPDGKRDRHQEFGRPDREFCVNRRVAQGVRPHEVPEGVIDQHADDEHGQRGSDGLHHPKSAARKLSDQQFHPDMAAHPLGVGGPEERHTRHGKLDKVDIAVDGGVEDRPQDDLQHTHHHQRHDRQCGRQIGEVFYRHEALVQAGEHAAFGV